MIVQRELDIDVLTAAKQRIRNIFANGLPVYLAFSGGKDSLVLADITAKLIESGEIDVRQLRVHFIDEEAIFPCVERVVRSWRDKFLLMGACFDWYCLEVKHFNCLNQLENDETFICWDSTKSDRWVRKPPAFAIRSHPLHKARQETYQAFLSKLGNGPAMTGLRVAESLQRRLAIAMQKPVTDLKRRSTSEPIYDWKDVDVWHYLYENNIDIPDAYLHLYQVGISKRLLRISQFFSIDTIAVLSHVAEYYPNLMERVLKREPAAYLVSLYWDSEMFRRRSRTRRSLERETGRKMAPGEARNEVFRLLCDPVFLSTRQHRIQASDYRRVILDGSFTISDKDYEDIYGALIAGDPKRRTRRAIESRVRGKFFRAAGVRPVRIGVAGNGRAVN